MKKFLLGCAVALACSAAFAAEPNFNALGFHLSLPICTEHASENGIKTDTNIFAFGFGIEGLTMYTEKLGMYASMDIVLPMTIDMSLTDGSITESYSFKASDYDSFWGMDMLLGPAISIIRNEKLLFTISPGIHYSMLLASANGVSNAGYLFGLGANAQCSFFLGQNFYAYAGADLAFDFLGCTVVSGGATSSGLVADFWIIPKVGIGIRF